MFRDRTDAGAQLGAKVAEFGFENPIVVALPRGGAIVGVEVARALNAPIRLLVARKVGHPQSPEYAIGAVCGDDPLVWNPNEKGAIEGRGLANALEKAREESRQRAKAYGPWATLPDLDERTAIVVDDGLATGSTARAALEHLRLKGAEPLLLAVPVAASQTAAQLRSEGVLVIALEEPIFGFGSVGQHYADFQQVSDREVLDALERRDRELRDAQ
ncbi:MAG: phosphoribosyltransferase [Armatimonadetes bacterium]|nr:MAG: phosphoribosyltransferase [Armatimonadota bacterium]